MARTMLVGCVLAAGCDGDPAAAGPCAPSGDPPATVADVVDRIDALSADGAATLPCLVASLPRPLPFEATSDVFSAQPAVGERSPRLLFRYPGLTLTVAPEGPGADLLELGEEADGKTVKAEILFPVDAPLDPAAPYDRVALADGGTGCGMCHGGEVEAAPGVYASTPFQPLPSTLVPLQDVAAEAAACGVGDDPRCALLRAVFDSGDVVHVPFPPQMPTIYDPPG